MTQQEQQLVQTGIDPFITVAADCSILSNVFLHTLYLCKLACCSRSRFGHLINALMIIKCVHSYTMCAARMVVVNRCWCSMYGVVVLTINVIVAIQLKILLNVRCH